MKKKEQNLMKRQVMLKAFLLKISNFTPYVLKFSRLYYDRKKAEIKQE